MQNRTPNLEDIFGQAISIYTRSQAITDGALVDVSAQARDAGFCIPVALTATVWADCVAWSEADSQRQISQDEWARLWDVLCTRSFNDAPQRLRPADILQGMRSA
ncbi:DUF6573 family protein [Burkholderia glumae]|uniref:DUF6573 family protein n=1 Tax=Burkholderia glumae TaxID=337 RepID=UPI000F5EBB5A|nr:DUF6573 family protein [Burkholderia glumae]